MDEAALFLSDKSNAVSVNLARGEFIDFECTVYVEVCEMQLLPRCLFFCFCVTDYVQVVDMGTLELRITAVKPGADGKLVRVVSV